MFLRGLTPQLPGAGFAKTHWLLLTAHADQTATFYKPIVSDGHTRRMKLIHHPVQAFGTPGQLRYRITRGGHIPRRANRHLRYRLNIAADITRHL